LCKANPKRSQMSYNGAKTCKTCSTSPTEWPALRVRV
jgi:hypothetical protein